MTELEQQLQAENERLRSEIENHKERELGTLRSQLAAALAERDHYKAEAERNAQIGRQIHNKSQIEINRLRAFISSSKTLPSREKRSAGRRSTVK